MDFLINFLLQNQAIFLWLGALSSLFLGSRFIAKSAATTSLFIISHVAKNGIIKSTPLLNHDFYKKVSNFDANINIFNKEEKKWVITTLILAIIYHILALAFTCLSGVLFFYAIT